MTDPNRNYEGQRDREGQYNIEAEPNVEAELDIDLYERMRDAMEAVNRRGERLKRSRIVPPETWRRPFTI